MHPTGMAAINRRSRGKLSYILHPSLTSLLVSTGPSLYLELIPGLNSRLKG